MANVPDTKAAKLSVIESISDKAAKLVAQNRQLTEQCDKLVRQNGRLAEDNAALKASIASLQRRVAVLELGEGFSGGGTGRKKAQARVGRLMREVDKCIALLNG